MQALFFSPSNDPGILGYRGPLSRKRAIEITAELQLYDERCFISNSFTGTYMEGSTHSKMNEQQHLTTSLQLKLKFQPFKCRAMVEIHFMTLFKSVSG